MDFEKVDKTEVGILLRLTKTSLIKFKRVTKCYSFFMMTLTFDEYLLYNRKLYVIFIKVRLSMKNLRQEWLGNTKGDILAGIVVFMALIPEVMGFMIVAGVDPMVGVYATFCMTMITAIFGGRPGLISAAAGAMALVLANLVRDYGLNICLQQLF